MIIFIALFVRKIGDWYSYYLPIVISALIVVSDHKRGILITSFVTIIPNNFIYNNKLL